MKRNCLRCDKEFKSEGNHNSCHDCFMAINYPEIELEAHQNYYERHKEKMKAQARAWSKAKRMKKNA